MFFFWFGSTQHIQNSKLVVSGARSSRVALFVACITHKRESDVCVRMADEVGAVIKPRHRSIRSDRTCVSDSSCCTLLLRL